jgi:hypothetical protein
MLPPQYMHLLFIHQLFVSPPPCYLYLIQTAKSRFVIYTTKDTLNIIVHFRS